MKVLIAVKFLVALSISFATAFLFSRGSFEKAELAFYDWRLKNSYSPRRIAAPVVVIGVTDGFQDKVGEPFSRKFYTQLLEILQKENASVIGFDIFFPNITDEAVDGEFIKKIESSGNVVLPVFSPTRLETIDGIVYKAPSVRGSDDRFHEAALSLGHINTLPDGDQVIRRVPLFVEAEGRLYPQMSLEIARLHGNKKELQFAQAGFITGPAHGTIPARKDGSLYIRLLPPEAMLQSFIPFGDVINGNYPPGLFRNKAVIVGQTIVGAKNADLVPTPWGTQFGVLLQTSILHNTLSGMHIYRLSTSTVISMIVAAGLLVGLAALSTGMTVNFLLFAGFSGALTYFSLLAMRRTGLFLDAVPFFVMSFGCYFVSIVYSLITAVKKLFRKENALKVMHQVEKEIADILNPAELPGITDDFSISGLEGTDLVQQTPEIALKTLMASLGISAGAFIMMSDPEKYRIIARQGTEISSAEIKKAIRTALSSNRQPFISNKPRPGEWGSKVKNILILPVVSHATFTILGVFINKKPAPFSISSNFTREDIPLIESLALQSIIAIQNARLNIALKDTQMESMLRLSMAIEYRDRETGMHIHRVSEYSGLIAQNIGLEKNETALIKSAMPLHDIGKIAIPDNILLKPGPLTAEERKIVEEHPLIGAKMLEGSSSLILKVARIITLYHHEKYDGSGYPFQLKGNSIPIYGRIATIADIFDAMSSSRVYKQAVDIEQSVDFLRSSSGKIFDPAMVEVFIKESAAIREIKNRYKDTETSMPPARRKSL